MTPAPGWLATAVICIAACRTTAPTPPPPTAPPTTTAARRTTGTGDTVTGTREPARLTAATARRLLLTDPTIDPHRPRLPERLNQAGARYVGLYRICVSSGGQVDSVKVNKGTGDAELDTAWMAVIRSWRYRPLEMSGRKVPFCYVSTVEVSS